MNHTVDGLTPYIYDSAMTTEPGDNQQEILDQEDISYER